MPHSGAVDAMQTIKLGPCSINGCLLKYGLTRTGLRPGMLALRFSLSNYSLIDWPTLSIASYINNVHPVLHEGLYTAIEGLLNDAIPLLNRTLTSTETPSRFFSPRIPVESSDDVPNREPGEYRTPEARTNLRYLKPHERVSVDLREDFGDTGVQVIVEISGILLRPETPEYRGEEWHVQGQLVHDPAY